MPEAKLPSIHAQTLTAASFLPPAGRLPGFAQRRLDLLLDENRSDALDRTEKRELRDMLQLIDRKSVEVLKHAVSKHCTPSSAK